MGLKLSKNFVSGDFGYSFPCPLWGFGYRSHRQGARGIVLWTPLDGAQNFECPCIWGLWILFSCPVWVFWMSFSPLRYSRHCFVQTLGWASNFRVILCLGILLSFSIPVMRILGIVLTARVLETLFCEELWMGLRVSKVSASENFGYRFRARYGDFGYRSHRQRAQGIVLWRPLDGGSEFQRFLRLGIWDIDFVSDDAVCSCRLRPRGLVYQEFWMGLKVSNNFGSGILAIVFRARYGDFGYRSHRQGTRAIGLWRTLDGAQSF